MTHRAKWTDRPLSSRETAVLEWVLAREGEVGRRYLGDLRLARVVRECECGCASIDLSVGGVVPLKPKLEPLTEYWFSRNGKRHAIFAFGIDSRLGGIEVYQLDADSPARELPEPSEIRSWEKFYET